MMCCPSHAYTQETDYTSVGRAGPDAFGSIRVEASGPFRMACNPRVSAQGRIKLVPSSKSRLWPSAWRESCDNYHRQYHAVLPPQVACCRLHVWGWTTGMLAACRMDCTVIVLLNLMLLILRHAG